LIEDSSLQQLRVFGQLKAPLEGYTERSKPAKIAEISIETVERSDGATFNATHAAHSYFGQLTIPPAPSISL
jgi:hypothetical protein